MVYFLNRGIHFLIHLMSIRMNQVILDRINLSESFFVKLANIEADTMLQATFNPVTITGIITTTCVKVSSFSFVATEKAVVCFSPVKWFSIPLMQVNDAGVVSCLLIAVTTCPRDFHGEALYCL